MTQTLPDPADTEPADQTVLYWPEGPDAFAVLAIRDDEVARLIHNDPDRHWFIPNSTDGPLTWDDLHTWCGEQDAPIANAVQFLPPGDRPVPFDPGTGPVPGYVAGHCGHRVAESEWRAGFRNCERCGADR